jgi:hypothetical protein
MIPADEGRRCAQAKTCAVESTWSSCRLALGSAIVSASQGASAGITEPVLGRRSLGLQAHDLVRRQTAGLDSSLPFEVGPMNER